MGRIVFVTEKPSVAREYVKVLGIKQEGKADGYVEGYSDFLKSAVAVTWCIGHLVTMSYPEIYDEDLKKWSLDTLPFLPDTYRYEVIADPGIRRQFAIIKRLYNDKNTDAIYYAGDSGREGIYIQALVRMQAGVRPGVLEKVVWIDSQTEDEIKRGIREAKDISAYNDLIASGYTRAIEDYAVGINFSRVLSCRFGREFNNHIGSNKWTTLSVGRVMTCVLGMIVQREREIRNFVETPFYRIEAQEQNLKATFEWKADEKSSYFESPLLYNETGFLKKEDAQALVEKFEKNPALTVEDIKTSRETKGAPLLYNLAEIQFECSKKYRISPDRTLQVVQSLYEKKLVTYPRTDARVLSSAVAKEIHNNLVGLSKAGFQENTATILSNKWENKLLNSVYVNDSKITDHYAIIPTGIVPNRNDLSELENDIYNDIARRFLCIFYPPAVFLKTSAVLIHDNKEHFYGSKKVLKEYGWYEVLPNELRPEIEENKLVSLEKGSVINADFSVKEGKTTPPKRYSSGSIILAMENAGKMIEDEELREQIKGSGIGTSATRAEIIKKLISNKYIDLNPKTQILTPDNIGEAVYDVVNSILPELLSPEMTANWEKGLSLIEAGALKENDYRKKLESYVASGVEKVKNSAGIAYTTERAEKSGPEIIGKCPNCGGEVSTGKFGAYCKNKCGMILTKAYGKTLSDSQVKNLLAGKKVLLKNLTSKDGSKKYDAYISAAGTQSFSYKGSDGQMKNGVGFKFDMEFPKK